MYRGKVCHIHTGYWGMCTVFRAGRVVQIQNLYLTQQGLPGSCQIIIFPASICVGQHISLSNWLVLKLKHLAQEGHTVIVIIMRNGGDILAQWLGIWARLTGQIGDHVCRVLDNSSALVEYSGFVKRYFLHPAVVWMLALDMEALIWLCCVYQSPSLSQLWVWMWLIQMIMLVCCGLFLSQARVT